MADETEVTGMSPAELAGASGQQTSALRIAVVGPTHPYKGGVASHTTTLAHELAEAGHDVTLVSWSHLYPSRLYPGEQAVPGGAPDVPPFPRTVRVLSWARPDTWVRTGRRLRDVDAIIVVHVIPIVIPAHLALLRAAGVGRVGAGGPGPRAIVIAHNVLPHEPHPGDGTLMRTLFSRVDAVLVHSPDQGRLAHMLGARHVAVADLPPHLPGGKPLPRPAYAGQPRLLAMGIVREYKGVDLLMRALMRVPGLQLTVAGEMWGESGELVRRLAQDPRLRDRVRVHGGYVPADRLAELFAHHDVMTLTYRHATASQNVLLAQEHGLAVLASDVGTFGGQVRDGVDGLLVPPNDEDALVEALQRLAEPGAVTALQEGVHPPDLSGPWADYVGALEALAAEDAFAEDVEGAEPPPPPTSLPARAVAEVRALVANRRRRLELDPHDLPEWVRESDVLLEAVEADEVRALGRLLGLPRCQDSIGAWAAMGALAAILRVRDDGRRTAVIVDESGSRSPLSRWARAIGFAPVELELTGHRSSVAVLDVDTASLDVITRLYPNNCDADDIDDAMSQASWALRTGGLLSVTLPLGVAGVDGAIGAADLRGVIARADDLGLVLVGDYDRDLSDRTAKARSAQESSPTARRDTAYGLALLTFRRR